MALRYTAYDQLRLFRRKRWVDNSGTQDLFFTWVESKKAYVYVKKVGYNNYEYSLPYHEENSPYGYSKVGEQVLNADDIWFVRAVKKIINKNKKEKTMKKDVNYIGGQYKAVSVCYTGDPLSDYTFKADLDLAAKMTEGTLIVAESSNGLGLATVRKVYDKDIHDKEAIKRYNEATAWIVDIVDTTAQDMRKDITERKEFILKELAERREQMQEIAIYEMLAKTDTEASKLLDELKELTQLPNASN